ncbi:hypothetical protein SAMN05216429_11177 [Marinobacter persicus]|uniref:Uncharacterized protein n=1 Tax=Marinobacter persicus TaxID=930118 RepID=A0A1I3X8L4_9GAMM|nr:hypothetical protein SAMN05216429_11177 [Marinobacter persicus]
MDNKGSCLYTCKFDSLCEQSRQVSRLDGVLAARNGSRLRLHSRTRNLIRIIPA